MLGFGLIDLEGLITRRLDQMPVLNLSHNCIAQLERRHWLHHLEFADIWFG